MKLWTDKLAEKYKSMTGKNISTILHDWLDSKWSPFTVWYRLDWRKNELKDVSKWLKKQLNNPHIDLLEEVQKIKHKDPDKTVVYALRLVKKLLKYKPDIETWKTWEYWAEAYEALNKGFDDCLAWDTKLLNSDGALVNIEDVAIGEKIIGKGGKLKTVINKWAKGKKAVYELELNNGSQILATEKHKFILADGSQKPLDALRIGDALRQINQISLDSEEPLDLDYWYLKGLFVADGWTDKEHKSIFISGKDGHPKEKQKEWVKRYCESNNIKYTWNERYIVVKSKELYLDFRKCGRRAIEKHVDTLPQNPENVNALIEGLKADAHIRKRWQTEEIVFATISEKLKNQIRVLLKMQGKECYTSLVQPTRTQFGNNPIWRIRVRSLSKPLKLIGIRKSIETDVYDIEVEDHEIYLPSSDCVVHNCDGGAVLLLVLCRLAGVPANQIRIQGGPVIDPNNPKKTVGHLYVRYRANKDFKWYHLDWCYHQDSRALDQRFNTLESDLRYHKEWWSCNDLRGYGEFKLKA